MGFIYFGHVVGKHLTSRITNSVEKPEPIYKRELSIKKINLGTPASRLISEQDFVLTTTSLNLSRVN